MGARSGRLSCVPLTAEILTPFGWKTHDQIKIGDTILGFDILREEYTWTNIKDIHITKDWLGKLKTNRGHDNKYTKGPYCTANHRWVIKDEKVIGFAYTGQLPRKYNTLIQPKKIFPEPENSLLTEIEAFLYGWYLTDGCKVGHKRWAMETSLMKKRSIDMIKDWLEKFNIKYTTSRYKYIQNDSHYVTRFYIGCDIFDDIYEKAIAVSPSELIMSLSTIARKAMFAAMLEADGSMRRGAARYDRFGQLESSSKRTSEYFELLSISNGQPYTYRRFILPSGKPFLSYYLHVRELYANKNYKWKPEYFDDVWCPETDCGTWVMRQGHEISVTGNCSKPNLQNIPKLAEYRSCFIAEEGNLIITADYSQIELRIAAVLSGEIKMLEEYNKDDADLHSVTGAGIAGVTIEELTKTQRYIGKTCNFETMYGISKYSMAEKLNVSVNEAERIIKRFWRVYPRLERYMRLESKKGLHSGRNTTLIGRRRYFDPPDRQDPDYGRKVSALERESGNTPVQGTAAEIMKLALVNLSKDIKCVGGKLVNTVHDEVEVELPEKNLDRGLEIIELSMLKAASEIVGDDIKWKVDANYGDNWAML